jgi:cytochrome c oxidase subunit 4
MVERREISVTMYVVICVVLVILTVLTVSLSCLPLPPAWHVVVGLLIGVSKASLVVLFFMHAILSSRLTWCVIVVSCFWLGLLLVLTLSDYFTRGLVPHMPGH